MQGTAAVQVVLGEGEPGILRFVLEAEGFQVVGQARGESELRRVLDVTHPSVVVLDAGISATAALDARVRATGAQLVVVWPDGVRASVAEERVDPASALQDLGGAVRRAAERATATWHDDVGTLPGPAPDEADPRPLTLVTAGAATHSPAGRRRSPRRLLVAAGALGIALTASAAIGLVVPRTLDLFERRATPHAPAAPSPDRPVADRPDGGTASPSDGSGDGRGPCARSDRPNGQGAGGGRPDGSGRACGADRGRGDGGPGDERDDPGHGGGGRPEHANGGDRGSGGNDRGNDGGNGRNGRATGHDATSGGGGNDPG